MVCALGPPGHCGSVQLSKPAAMEACNTQPCDLPPGKNGGGQLEPGLASCPASNLASTSCPCASACALSPQDHPPLRSPCVRPLPSTKARSRQPHQAACVPRKAAPLPHPPELSVTAVTLRCCSGWLWLVRPASCKLLEGQVHFLLLVLFICSVVCDSLLSRGLQYASPPCSSSSPGVCSNSGPLSQ